ncbi:SNN1 (YNL086W) [Zygosaccharomyces parabailii]|uniref:ZYBA0S04-08174g1_1 n=1 Tax=Zygosaccharomyces bailii (strain CLIB 213 / ATCC 58445 / CBS 680 / BCRC 21525 / NBRC 1098 / NCYC 1416 / NRRL Y-2227) TaxID=1333698 RepID=A0A8J2T7K9_ZYGB2|nr:SNN1 (YNL086W) [Zygosaccharomyces parabailii]CDF89601.1 ZYBA0S04-08174g1_1 [Zygosaccharomyces bailii CLIB 213]CDH13719.1 probable Biogenesis of lysosome-related organelles complex 1 subunit SNN1 [Zygosaccharomyces bailii ISA1307]SJM87464.1 probable Biogenesis of lysosome-related organelles complex 1 subunit SNN1 [Zygosaccharomyces bailii]
MQTDETAECNAVHPAELIVYSLLSNDLDGIYQSIGELRESQALLILMLKKMKSSLRDEMQLMYDKSTLKEADNRLENLEKRVQILQSRFHDIKTRSDKLHSKETS